MAGEQDRGGGGPPRLERVKPGGPGLAARVTPAAALAAALAMEGTLEESSALHLCYLAAAAQATGRLVLQGDRGGYALHFRRGVLEHAASSAMDEELGRFLVARGAIGASALADAERVKGEFGGDLVTALAHLRLLNPAESFRILQEHGLAVLSRALTVERGAFRWEPAAPPPASAFPLGSRWGLPCDAVRRLDGLAVRRLLGDRAQRIAARAGGRVALSDLKLTAHEARAATLFDGRTSPAQLAAAHPADADVVLRVALLLAETELLSFGEVAEGGAPAAAARAPAATAKPIATPPPVAATAANANANANTNDANANNANANTTASPAPTRKPAAPPVKPAAPPKPPAAPAKPVSIPQDANALRLLYERISAADHFEALGVKREATAAQVKAAYFQLAKTYHPDAAPATEPAATKKLRADIFARLGEAWRVLGDDASRAAYVELLATGGGAQVDVSAIFEAEQAFQKAVVLVRARQYDKASALLADAMKLNPDEPEFTVWNAWVDFLLAADKKRQMAASAAAIEAALQKNPRCLPGYLFLGQMARLQGEVAVAERHLKRGLALDPDNAELARELKFARR